MIKIKSFIWVLLILFLIGVLVILYHYTYTGIEGFNTNAPRVKRQLKTTSPISVAAFYGGRDWFHLNSLLFFNKNGQRIQYGRDYKVYSTDGFGKWGAQDYSILFNNNPNKKNTYYHSSSTDCTFVILFNTPQYISRIYIRNRLNANNSGDRFSDSWLGIKYRIQNYKFMLWSVERNENNDSIWKEAIYEHRLGEDTALMRGPNYDIIFDFIPYRDLAAEIAAAAAAKTEAERNRAEDLRKKTITTYLTKVTAYEQSAKSSYDWSNISLQQLQKYANDTTFLTEPIKLDIDTSNDIKSDSIIQKSNNNMISNLQTSRTIAKNIKKNQPAIKRNLNNAIGLLKKIAAAYNSIVSQEISLPDIKRQLTRLTASSEDMQVFADSQRKIETYKENAYNNITSANISIDEIISNIKKIASSEDIAKENVKIIQRMEKVKRDITDMTDKNKKDNEMNDKILQEIITSTNSVFGRGIAPGLVV